MPRFERDETKRADTIATRGVDFADPILADWSQALRRRDVRRAYGEDRWRVLVPLRGQLHVIILAAPQPTTA